MIDENLKKAIRDNKLVLFIGAGASTPLKHPSWKDLVSGILDYLDLEFGKTSDLNFNNLKDSLSDDSRNPLDILNRLEGDNINGDTYIKRAKEYTHETFNGINNTNSLDSSIHKLLWELSSKIITTNYDKVLEANMPNDRTIDVFENANSYLTRKSQHDDSKFLYKIHGDFKNPDTIILFERDYNAIYREKTSNSDALGDFFKNKTFLFLGFSLSDPFVNELFSKIKRMYNNYKVGSHFIFSTTHTGDFSKYDVKKIMLNNWTDSLEKYLKDLIAEKKKVEIISTIDRDPKMLSNQEDNLEDLSVLIKSKIDELKKDPGNQVLASEMHDIKSKIDQLIYGDLDYLKTFNKEYKNTHIQMLFDTIYATENLSKETFDEINRIRHDYNNHKWFERCQLVSALTCNLFIFNKADEKKISLLVDFINDNEDKVWERALTYLVMILNHLGNKWLRFEPLKKKIKSLTLNAQIQTACQEIVEYILVFGIGRYNFTEKVFENPYFRENPYNYFLPFFRENNPLFENVYDNYNGEDIEQFIEALDKSPYPDSFKYIMCNTESPIIDRVEDNNDSHFIKRHFNINGAYFPYAGYIQEFVSFINGFPALQNEKLIDTQLKITSTPLKDYLLSEKEKFRILGIHFHKDKNWGQAIVNFEKYIYLQPDDLMVLDNLANCYLNNKMDLKAKEISIRISVMFPKQKYNLLRLAEIYFAENNNQLALDTLDNYISIDSSNSLVYFKKAIILIEFKKYQDALGSIQNVDDSFENKADLHDIYGTIYRKLERYDESLKSYEIAISLDEKRALFYYHKAELYNDIADYEKAIEFINKALSIDSSDNYYYNKFYYLLNFNRAEEAYSALSRVQNRGEEYSNALANYYRLIGNYEMALMTIEKLIKLSDDKRFVGTKAAIYASMEDHDNFYKFLEVILIEGVDAKMFLPDIKHKYKNENRFIETLYKYNQVL